MKYNKIPLISTQVHKIEISEILQNTYNIKFAVLQVSAYSSAVVNATI